MTPTELAAHLGAALTMAEPMVELGELTVWLPPENWVAGATHVREDPAVGADWLDLLTAWDELADDAAPPLGFVVVLQLFSTSQRHRVRLATRIPRAVPHLATLTGVYPGVDWQERETAEMFGITFVGHPNPVPLLLPDAVLSGESPHPLRKEVQLAARDARPWPGEVEP